MWFRYGYWHPWVYGRHRHRWIHPFAWLWAFPSKEEKIFMLEEQSKILGYELESIKKRLEELKQQEVNNA